MDKIDAATLENLDDLSPEEREQVAELVSAQYKTLQSATTKGVKNMNDAIAFYKTNAGDVGKVKSFVETNPDAGKILLEKFYDGKTLEEINPVKSTETDDIDVRIKNAVEGNEVAKKLAHYRLQLPEDQRTTFDAEYTAIVGTQKVTLESLPKFVKATIGIMNPDMDNSLIEQAKIASAGTAGNKRGGHVSSIAQKAADSSNAFLISQ